MTARIRCLVILYALPFLLLAGVVVTCLARDLPPFKFTRDPATIANIHPLTGLLSHTGVLLWTATAAICLLTWALSRAASQRAWRPGFFLSAGLLSGLLGLDDLFLLHESIFPRLLGTGEDAVFLFYALLLAAAAVVYRDEARESYLTPMVLSLVFFGLSLGVDTFQYQLEAVVGRWRILFEDGFKLLGIVGWFGYFLRCSLDTITVGLRFGKAAE